MILGYTPMKLPADKHLGRAVCSHPDTVLFCSGDEIITTAEFAEDSSYFFSDLREYAPSIRLEFTADERKEKYPDDCIMNALVIGDKIFCKSDTISDAVKNFAARHGMKIIHTNQGYPACVTLAFGNSAITADRGIAAVLQAEGISVTLIRQGHILLDSCEYGFIGGASGVVDKTVYFNGNVNLHPDGEIICKAVKEAGFVPISLTDEPLRDIGGMIFIKNHSENHT